MSRKITLKTNIKDATLAEQALKTKGWSYRLSGAHLDIDSGPMRGTRIDLGTGEVVGDSDYHGSALGELRQAYAEAEVRAELFKQGHTIESRTVDQQGVIHLLCQMA